MRSFTVVRGVYNPRCCPWYLLSSFEIVSSILQSQRLSRITALSQDLPDRPLIRSFPYFQLTLFHHHPLPEHLPVFKSLGHLSTPYHQTLLLLNHQQSLLSKWPAIASPPQTPRSVSSQGFGFATIASTSITVHFALRDVAFVLITSVPIAPPAEGRARLCQRVGHAESEGHKRRQKDR